MKEQAKRVTDKLVRERTGVLQADQEFRKLRKLLPPRLKGKELGKDVKLITNDPEIWQKRKDIGQDILLSEGEWRKYEEFCALCEKLAKRYGLYWATVEDLAMGVKQPTVPPRLSQVIKAYLDPLPVCPEDFDPGSTYTAHIRFVPPLQVIEIVRRLQGLDEQTREEVKAYLRPLLKDKPGCRILELEKGEDSKKDLKNEVEIEVCMKIPAGYTANEVAEVYRKVDSRRREVLAALGVSVPKRRRESKILREASSLQLSAKNVDIYGILDKMYPEDMSEDRTRRRTIVNRRYKGRKLLEKRYRHLGSSVSS